MTPEDCSKFSKCNAPVCPLDADWTRRRHISGDPSCLYLREVGKEGAEKRLNRLQPREMYLTVASVSVQLDKSAAGPGHSALASALRQRWKAPSVLDRRIPNATAAAD